MKIPLVGSSYKGVSAQLDSQRTRNLMVERANSKNAAAPSALIATPGLSYLNVTSTTAAYWGPVIAMLELPRLAGALCNSLLYAIGPFLYRLDCDETVFAATGAMVYTRAVVLGMDVFTNPYRTMLVGNSVIVLIVNCANSVTIPYTISSGAIGGQVFFSDATTVYPSFIDMVYLAGYFVGFTQSGTGAFQYLRYSADGTTWSSLDFFMAEADSSELVKLEVKNGHLWVFKGKSIQIFSPTGDANNPFAPIESATIQKGCKSKESVRMIGDYIYFLGGSEVGGGFIVYRVQGAIPQQISSGFVDTILQDTFNTAGPKGISDIVGSVAVERGRNLYKLHCHAGKITLVFDETTQEWHERGWVNPESGDYEEELGTIECAFNGKHIAGDRRAAASGTGLPAYQQGIYEVSEQYTSNNIIYPSGSVAHTAGTDTIIRRERISPIFTDRDEKMLFCDRVELVFERGLAAITGQGSDPKVTLYISRDGGSTWGNGLTRTIGKVGKNKSRCTFDRLGSAYKFVFKIVMTDPIAWKLISANADLERAA